MLDGIRGNSQSFLVKLLFAIIILVFVFWGVQSFTSTNNMVATVNGLNITPAEFEAMYYQYSSYVQSEEDVPAIQNYILSSLIERKLMQSDAERTGISISPIELRMQFASMPEFLDAGGNFSPELYMSTLSGINVRPAKFEADMAATMLPDKVYGLLTSGVQASPEAARAQFDYEYEQRSVNFIAFPASEYMENAQPTEEELVAAYESRLQFYGVPAQIKLEYVTLTAAGLSDASAVNAGDVEAEYNRRLANGEYFSPTMVSARHILITVAENASEAEVTAARERIDGIRNRILVGEDFAAVAIMESQDPGSAPTGGDLGFFSREQMVQEFADAAFAMEIGAISEPVRSSFGFHLIKVEDRTEEHTTTLAEAEAEIREQLAADLAAGALQSLAEQVFAQVKGGQTLDVAASSNNVSLLETQLISQDQLSTAIGLQSADTTLVMGTPAGQLIDQLLQTTSGYTIARVMESNPATVRSLDDVRSELTQSLTRDEARRLAQDQAAQVRQSFVDGKPGAEYAERIQSTELFGNDGYIPGIGMSIQLARAVFDSPISDAGQDLWLADAYIGDEAAVLVSLNEVTVPENDNWLLEQDTYLSYYGQNKAQIFYKVYMSEMYRTGSVKPQNQAYFEYWQ